uniref:hypothetical protein n=1 Tax=Nonomuraea sp. CA-251285 TaxID=3240002 RepID=UPI003F499455
MSTTQGGLPNPLSLPPDLRDALESLWHATALSSRDWTASSVDAWLWGIVHGYDCCERPDGGHTEECTGVDPLTAPGGIAERYDWREHKVAALRRYNAAFVRAMGEGDERLRAALELASYAAQQSPRYEGLDGALKLLAEPGTVEHAYRAAQQANPHGGPEYLAQITRARNLLTGAGS